MRPGVLLVPNLIAGLLASSTVPVSRRDGVQAAAVCVAGSVAASRKEREPFSPVSVGNREFSLLRPTKIICSSWHTKRRDPPLPEENAPRKPTRPKETGRCAALNYRHIEAGCRRCLRGRTQRRGSHPLLPWPRGLPLPPRRRLGGRPEPGKTNGSLTCRAKIEDGPEQHETTEMIGAWQRPAGNETREREQEGEGNADLVRSRDPLCCHGFHLT